MAEMGGTLSEEFHTTAPPEQAAAWFADPVRIQAATEHLRRGSVEGDTIHFELEPQNHGVYTFEPTYGVCYTREGDTLTWAPSGPGNLVNRGRASFRASGSGTTISFTQTIGFELPVGRLAARLLSPVVGKLVVPSMRRYVQQMIAGLEGR